MTDQSIDGFLLGSGIPSFSFKNIGDEVEGVITDQELSQQTDYDDDSPLFTKAGKPMMQLILTIQTDLRNWAGTSEDSNCRERPAADDDGKRKLYIKSGGRDALAKAVRRSGSGGIGLGGRIKMKLSSEDKVEGSKYKKKNFTTVYTPGTLSVEEDSVGEAVAAPKAAESAPAASAPAAPPGVTPEQMAAIAALFPNGVPAGLQ